MNIISDGQMGAGLSAVIKKTFDMNTVVVIECPKDYSVNYASFSKEIEDLTCEM